MKILYFHQYFGTRAGSNGIRSYEVARALTEAGHRVTMVCASFAGSTTGLTGPFERDRRCGSVDGIDVVEFDLSHSNRDSVVSRSLKFVNFALRSMTLALREDCDLVLASSTPLTVGLPGIVAKVIRRKPFVFEVRDLWPELPRAMGMTNPLLLGGMALLERASYAAADRVIGLAPGIVNGIVGKGKPPSDVAMIPNGCDFDLFDDVDPIHASALFPDAIAKGDFVAIFAGAHGKANGLDAIVEAAAALQQRKRSDIKFLLIGQGSEKARLQSETAQRGLANIVFAEVMPKNRVAALIKGSGAGLQVLANVSAFYNGTSPNKFFDYLAAGRPILINYPGWLAELVVGHTCGVAVPPGDVEKFADAIEQVADQPATCAAMGTAARKVGEDLFDRREQTRKLRALLEDVMRRA